MSTADYEALNKLFTRILPRELGSRDILDRHVRLVFAPIVIQLARHRPDVEAVLSGSLAEGMYLPEVKDKQTGEYIISSDLDVLFKQTGDEIVQIKKPDRLTDGLYADDTDCDLCYTRIACVEKGKTTFVQYTQKVNDSLMRANVGSPSLAFQSRYRYFMDRVLFHVCSDWPEIAQDIFKSYSWPPPELIEELKRTKILLVHKVDGSRKHADDEYWRYSFSLPEKCLSRSLSDFYRYVYLITKLLLKYHFRKLDCLKSYYLKTSLFWYLRSGDDTQNTAVVVVDLLKKVRDYFKKKCLPHFFIPEVNLLTVVEDSDAEEVVKILERLIADPVSAFKTLAESINILNYSDRDQSIHDVKTARQLLSDSLRASGSKRIELQQQAEGLLWAAHNRTPPAVEFQLPLMSLIHLLLLTGKFERACLLYLEYDNIHSLNATDRDPRQFTVIKISKEQMNLFSDTLATSLSMVEALHCPISRYIDYIGAHFHRQLPKDRQVQCRRHYIKSFLTSFGFFLTDTKKVDAHYMFAFARHVSIFSNSENDLYARRAVILFCYVYESLQREINKQPQMPMSDLNDDDPDYKQLLSADESLQFAIGLIVRNDAFRTSSISSPSELLSQAISKRDQHLNRSDIFRFPI